MDFNKPARKAQKLYTERGGVVAAKGDAGDVAEIFKGDGTLADEAKRAAKALKEPGTSHAWGPQATRWRRLRPSRPLERLSLRQPLE